MFLTGERHLKPPTQHLAAEPRNGVKERPVDRQQWLTEDAASMAAPAPARAHRRDLREAVNRTGSMANDQPKPSAVGKRVWRCGVRLSGWRSWLAQSFPRAVSNRDMDRPVATQRLKRNLGLEICREPASCRHLRIPPSMGGIHLSSLADFLGPAQLLMRQRSQLPIRRAKLRGLFR